MSRPKALTPIEAQGVIQMHKDRKPIAEIAYTFKVSPSTVQRIVRDFKKVEEEKNNDE